MINQINEELFNSGIEDKLELETVLIGDECELDSVVVVTVLGIVESIYSDKGKEVSLFELMMDGGNASYTVDDIIRLASKE